MSKKRLICLFSNTDVESLQSLQFNAEDKLTIIVFEDNLKNKIPEGFEKAKIQHVGNYLEDILYCYYNLLC